MSITSALDFRCSLKAVDFDDVMYVSNFGYILHVIR